MKKDRNSFFSGYGYGPVANNMGMGMNNFVPNQAVSASNQFYAGPAYQDIGMNNMSGMNNNMYTDIDSRLSKVSRMRLLVSFSFLMSSFMRYRSDDLSLEACEPRWMPEIVSVPCS